MPGSIANGHADHAFGTTTTDTNSHPANQDASSDGDIDLLPYFYAKSHPPRHLHLFSHLDTFITGREPSHTYARRLCHYR
jgi:hypothetical protein